jgi:hypothetical protein
VRQWTTNGDGVLILRQDRERSPAEAAQLARRVQVGRPRPVTPDRTRAARGLVASGRRGPPSRCIVPCRYNLLFSLKAARGLASRLTAGANHHIGIAAAR